MVGGPAADAADHSAIHIRRGVQVHARTPQTADVTQLHQWGRTDDILNQEMHKVKDYIKTTQRRTKPHEKNARTHDQNRGKQGGKHPEPRAANREGNDRGRNPALHARPRQYKEPAAARSRGKPLSGARDASGEKSGASKRGPAHQRHLRIPADGGYQKSALRQKRAPSIHLDDPVRPEGKPTAEYDLHTKSYLPLGPAGDMAAPAAPGLLDEEKLRSLGEAEMRANEHEQTPPPAESAGSEEQKPHSEVLPPPAAELQTYFPAAGSVGSAGAASGVSPTAPVKDVPDEKATTAKDEAVLDEHQHGVIFQRVEEKLRVEEKGRLLRERGAAAMVAGPQANVSDASLSAQGVHLTPGAAQKNLTSDLQKLGTSGKLTQVSANDAVLNWLSASHNAKGAATGTATGATTAKWAAEKTRPDTFDALKRATDMVATDSALTEARRIIAADGASVVATNEVRLAPLINTVESRHTYTCVPPLFIRVATDQPPPPSLHWQEVAPLSSTPWYQRFGPFDTSM